MAGLCKSKLVNAAPEIRRGSALVGDDGWLFWYLVLLCLLPGKVDLVIDASVHDGEQLIELAVLRQASDRHILPVCKLVAQKVSIFVAR